MPKKVIGIVFAFLRVIVIINYKIINKHYKNYKLTEKM